MKVAMGRGEQAGERLARAVIEWADLFYNLSTRRRVLCALRNRLDREIRKQDRKPRKGGK